MYYRSHCCGNITKLSADNSVNLNTIQIEFKELINNIFNGRDPKEKELFKKTFKQLSNGVYKGYKKNYTSVKYNSPDFKMLNELNYNVGVFSVFKNHTQINELVQALKNQDGSLRSFKEFEAEATKIIGKYNKRYLQVEYNQAVTTARAAKEWAEIQRTKHLYPNLTYIAIQDDRTRLQHKQWHGITLPVDHKFWDTHYPPNDWECRCKVRRSDKAIDTKGYDVENSPELAKQFNNNAGKTGKVFTEDHPYFKTKEYNRVATLANSALINYGRKEVKEYLKATSLTNKSFKSAAGVVTISNKALDHIVSTYHKNAYLRNNLLYDIKGVLENAKYIKEAVDGKSNPMVKKYHYLLVTVAKEKFYLNVREMVNGELVLYAITNKIQ